MIPGVSVKNVIVYTCEACYISQAMNKTQLKLPIGMRYKGVTQR